MGVFIMKFWNIIRNAALFITLVFAGHALAGPVLNSAVLPNARTVAAGDTATVLMTTINSGDADAFNCTVVASNTVSDPSVAPLVVEWARIDSSGALIGNQNDPFGIPAGSNGVNLVLGIRDTDPNHNFGQPYMPVFHVQCAGGVGSLGWPAVNGASLLFSTTGSEKDILPIIQTLSKDGIANFEQANGLAVVSVAAVSNSAIKNGTGPVPFKVRGKYLGFTGFTGAGQFDFFACETDPANGACTSAIVTCSPGDNCLDTMIGATPTTYAFFVILPAGKGALFAPNLYRFAIEFAATGTAEQASTSVALNSAAPNSGAGRPVGQHELRLRNTADFDAKTLRTAIMTINDGSDPDSPSVRGYLDRVIPQNTLILLLSQYFESGSATTFTTQDTPGKTGQPSPQAGSSTDLVNIFVQKLFPATLKPGDPAVIQEYDATGSDADYNAALGVGGSIVWGTSDPEFTDPADADLLDLGKEGSGDGYFIGGISQAVFDKRAIAGWGNDPFDTPFPVFPGPDPATPNESAHFLDSFLLCDINLWTAETSTDPGTGYKYVTGISVRTDNCDDTSPVKSFEGNVQMMNFIGFPIDLSGSPSSNNPRFGRGTLKYGSGQTAIIRPIFFSFTTSQMDRPQTTPAARPGGKPSAARGPGEHYLRLARKLAAAQHKPVYWAGNGHARLLAAPAGMKGKLPAPKGYILDAPVPGNK